MVDDRIVITNIVITSGLAECCCGPRTGGFAVYHAQFGTVFPDCCQFSLLLESERLFVNAPIVIVEQASQHWPQQRCNNDLSSIL